MLNLTITADLNNKLKALLCFAPSKDSRCYLNGVCLDVSNGTLRGVATDGHMMGVTVLGTVTAPDGQYILPREFVERIVKTRDIFELTVSADSMTASHGHSCKPIEGKFPDWRRVAVIQAGKQAVASYDADLLARIAKASRALGNKKGYFAMTQHGQSSAPFQIANDFVGVIMPLRMKDAGTINAAEFHAVTGV